MFLIQRPLVSSVLSHSLDVDALQIWPRANWVSELPVLEMMQLSSTEQANRLTWRDVTRLREGRQPASQQSHPRAIRRAILVAVAPVKMGAMIDLVAHQSPVPSRVEMEQKIRHCGISDAGNGHVECLARGCPPQASRSPSTRRLVYGFLWWTPRRGLRALREGEANAWDRERT